MLESFKPIAAKGCRVLILGTMPGAESLRRQQYYAFERNHFWRLMFEIFLEEYSEDYHTRTTLLKEHHIALWDVLKHCERETSSDTKIRNPEPNDFKMLLQQHTDIRHIFFNGKKAEELF